MGAAGNAVKSYGDLQLLHGLDVLILAARPCLTVASQSHVSRHLSMEPT